MYFKNHHKSIKELINQLFHPKTPTPKTIQTVKKVVLRFSDILAILAILGIILFYFLNK